MQQPLYNSLKIFFSKSLFPNQETSIFATNDNFMKEKFKVVFLQEALNFLDKLDEKTRDKILFNIDRVKITEDRNLFKKLTSDIWEFRTIFNRKLYRLFAFWDKTSKTRTIVIATHGIIKKTTKIPKKEIDKAIELMKKYFNDKF